MKKIIDRPEKKSPLRKITELTITAFFWSIWIYLILPLINLLMWILGVKVFYHEVIVIAGYKQLIQLLRNSGILVILIFCALRMWGYYNYRRFGLKNRRLASRAVSDEEIVRYFGIEPEEIKRLKESKAVTFIMQENGNIKPVILSEELSQPLVK